MSRVLLLFSALGLAGFLPARAAPVPKTKDSAAPPPKTATAALPVWSSSAPPSLAQLQEHFSALDRSWTSLSARLSQSVFARELGASQTLEGRVRLLKPKRLRIEYESPQKQLVVCDGKTLWLHRPEQNQVIESSLEDWRKSDPSLDSLLSPGSYASLLSEYSATLRAESEPWTLELVPKKGLPDVLLRLSLAPRTLLPERTEIALGSWRAVLALSDVVVNAPLEPKLFEFEPPPGADVIRDFKPPRPTGGSAP